MRSPFHFFRKHQKESLVILIGMAMISFVFLGSISNIGTLTPWMWVVLIAVIAAGAAWVVGTQTKRGKQSEFALWGAVAGTAIGLVVMMLNRPAPAVSTTDGNLSQKQLQDMIQRRTVAVRFMTDAYDASVDPSMNSFQHPFGRLQAAFYMSPEQKVTKRGVVLKFLLLKEAKKLGIKVDDAAVKRYINRATNERLSTAAYLRIRDNLHVSEDELFDILREEIAAQLMSRLLAMQPELPPRVPIPPQVAPPARYWERYRKLNVSEQLEFAEVPVKAFLDKVGKPTESDLRDLFDKYKDRFPSPQPSAEPAFGLPERIQIAYFKPDYEAVEADVVKRLEEETLSRQEIQSALEKIDQGIAEVEKKIRDGEIKRDDARRARIDAKRKDLRALLTSGRPINRLEFEIVKYYEDNKSVRYANPNWAKKFPAESGGKRRPVEAPRPKSRTPEKPAGTKPNVKKPAGNSGARRKLPAMPLQAAAAVPMAATLLLAPPPSPAKKPAGTPPAAGPEPPAEGAVRLPPPPPLPKNPLLPFRPLDDLLRQEIRGTVLQEHVSAEIRDRMKKAAAAMERESRKYLDALDAKQELDGDAVSRRLKRKANDLGLDYVATDLVDRVDFERDNARYPMAQAVQVSQFPVRFSPFNPSGFIRGSRPRISDLLFGRPRNAREKAPRRLYRVIRAAEVEQVFNQRQLQGMFVSTTHVYVLWKTAHTERRIPDFSEKEVREKVLQAWKEIEARSPAEKRAKALAAIVRGARKPMDEALQKETITGEADAAVVRTERIRNPITWLSLQRDRSSAPALGFPQERLIETPLVGIDKPGDDFRRTIFEMLKDGEVGVAANADKSAYYVVRVLERHPTTEEAWKVHMEQMLAEDPFGTGASRAYQDISSPGSPLDNQLRQSIENELFQRYNVHMGPEAAE